MREVEGVIEGEVEGVDRGDRVDRVDEEERVEEDNNVEEGWVEFEREIKR